MARALHALIQAAQIPELIVRTDSAWSADTVDHRALIRASLARELTALTDAERSELLQLKQTPRPRVWSVSITHAQGESGWAAVPRPRQIGFDLEVRARVRPELIRRLCLPDELNAAPDAVLLWPAKEAAFKAMADLQPQTVSQIRTEGWTPVGTDGVLHFVARAPRASVLGWAVAGSAHIYSLCLFSPYHTDTV